MTRPSPDRSIVAALALLTFIAPALAGYSVDEDPRETPLDPGDVFLPGPGCDVDDGDASCPPPSLNVPNPGPDADPTFDMDAFAVDLPLVVCPQDPPYIPGILFSLDDGDPGPGVGPPDNTTEMFLYDHCNALGMGRLSYHTSIIESALGLNNDPSEPGFDDDVDAYDTRPAGPLYQDGFTLLFSPDTPSTGGLGTAEPQAHVWFVNSLSATPAVWANAATDIGVPDPENCDIDGIAPIREEETPFVLLFTTDLEHDCGLDPGDIWVTDTAGNYWLYADDVNDMKIALNEDQRVDVDALAINDGGSFDPGEPYEPPDPDDRTFYKADWPNYAASGMPDFSQDHAQWPSTWCGPTALADSFWWFDSEMACDADLTLGQNSESEPNDSCDLANRLGVYPPIPANFGFLGDEDWYSFELPDKPYRTCRVTVSTCALASAGDDDTTLELFADCDVGSGTPAGLIAANDDGCPDPTLRQSEIRVDLPAGSRYWVRVAQGPLTAGVGNYHLSLGIDCYPMVRRYPEAWDDHSNQNPRPLIEDLAWCMNTDDVQGTGSSHRGTLLPEMELCVEQWLLNNRLLDMYLKTVALAPAFDEVSREIEKSEDVVLLLGFWWQPPQGTEWYRCGGHYVTAAGVDFDQGTISVSDPALNNAETGAPGRVRGPNHSDHAPAVTPPPDHDDTQNISHDRYGTGAANVPSHASFSLPTYATNGTPTTCGDVARWCLVGMEWGQNPAEPPTFMEACTDPSWPVSTEVEAMVDVSPRQTEICVYLDTSIGWPENLVIRKGPCTAVTDVTPKDLIRGKLCNLRFSMMAPQVDLGFVQCLYDDSLRTEFDELSPDDTRCMGGWYYLIRNSGDTNYGQASGGEVRLPATGGCP
jgi:hypothetical protein